MPLDVLGRTRATLAPASSISAGPKESWLEPAPFLELTFAVVAAFLIEIHPCPLYTPPVASTDGCFQNNLSRLLPVKQAPPVFKVKVSVCEPAYS